MRLSISLSLRNDCLARDAGSCVVIEARQTNFTNSIFPGGTIFHLAGAIYKVVVALACSAVKALHVQAPLHFTAIALEFEIGKTISALAALVADTS